MMKTWYSAMLLFEARIDQGRQESPLREESIRIILADSEDDARTRAEDVGRGAEHQYPNEQGEIVRWTFISVLEIQDLCEQEVQDGMEVFSRMFKD